MFLTPRRRRGIEILDASDVPDAVRQRSHRDIALANVLFGGRRALRLALRDVARALPPQCTVLDVGAGSGIGALWIRKCLLEFGVHATVVALDVDFALARSAAAANIPAVCGSVTQLPVRAASVDLVVCSLLLHHFGDSELGAVVCELNRVARVRVIVADLRRSWVAAAGIWLTSFFLGFHPVSRHDGVVSVMRGFTAKELSDCVARFSGATAQTTRRLGFRLVATWAPA